MGQVADSVVDRIEEDRPFDFKRHEIEAAWVQAADERFQQRRIEVPALDALARENGIERITRLEELVPLLFAHSTYKSYPRTFLDKGRWDGMTRWLNTLSTADVSGLDVAEVSSQDEWMAALAKAGHPVYASSGTSGKSSFLPATTRDRQFTMRCILRALLWQHGLRPDQDLAVVVLAPSQGTSRSTEYFNAFAAAYGDPARTWFLTDEPVRLQDMSRMATLSKAIADGTANPSEIAAFEGEAGERRARLEEDWDRLVGVVPQLEGQRVVIQGFWAQQWALVERLRARGISEIRLDPGSVLGAGGGTKGVAMPDDFEQQIFNFWGLDESRQSGGYGMSELSAAMPQIGDRYAIQPWIIPLVLDEDGTTLLNADRGQVEGRFAFLDLAVEGRWGGIISGDRVVADFDTPATTIVAGSVIRYSELRGGDDDRLTCAGTVDAFVRGFAGSSER